MRIGRILATSTVVVALAIGCGSDDDDTTAPATTDPSAPAAAADGSSGAEDAPEADGDAEEASTSGGDGRLVLGDETIELDEVRCTLEPQEAAAGGGKILFVGQGMGVDAEGRDVLLDVSRYDQDSQFEGDDVTVDIGDITSGDTVGLSSTSPTGTVTVDGSTLRADDVTLMDSEDGTEQTASFEINC